MPTYAVNPAMLVVHRNPCVSPKRTIPVWRNHRVEGHQPMRRPPIVMAPIGVSSGGYQKAVIGFDDVEFWRRVATNEFAASALPSEHTIFCLLGDQDSIAMQAGEVTGIDAAFQRLQIVALFKPSR